MTGYQAGISKFEGMDVKVFGASVDNQPTLAHWAKELGATFPLLSDHMRATAMKYGVLLPAGFCSRTTFIIDAEGKIVEIIEGSAALDAAGSEEACRRVPLKKP